MSESMEAERSRNPRPRWKNYPEAIEYILERTIPEHPVPRGKFRQLFPQVAKEVNEKFDFGDRKADAKGVKYVTEKYGSDPVFGNRKMQVVHPAKGKTSTREKKNLMRAKRAVENGAGNLILCPHCEGNGFVDAGEYGDEDRESESMTSGPPSPVNNGGYGAMHHEKANSIVGTSTYQGLQPSIGNPGCTFAPSSMVGVPDTFHNPQQSGQVFQQMSHYQPQATAPPMMGNNSYSNPNGITEPPKTLRNVNGWNVMGGTTGQEIQKGQMFGLVPGESRQPAPIPPSSAPYGWQNNSFMNANAIDHQSHGQISQEASMAQMGGSIQIDPALRSGVVNGFRSTGGGNATAKTPGSGLRLSPNGQAEESKTNNTGHNAGPYGNSLAEHQATIASAQPGIIANNQLLGLPPASGANVSGPPGDFLFANDGYDFAIDPALLNQPLTEPNNNLGDNQDFVIDGDFNFVQFMNENPDFFNV